MTSINKIKKEENKYQVKVTKYGGGGSGVSYDFMDWESDKESSKTFITLPDNTKSFYFDWPELDYAPGDTTYPYYRLINWCRAKGFKEILLYKSDDSYIKTIKLK